MFDPPRPPRESPLRWVGYSAAGLALLIVYGFAISTVGYGLAAEVVALLAAAGLGAWRVVQKLSGYPRPPTPRPAQEPSIATAPPRRAEGGGVICTGCGRAVPFASMALDERGYFCQPCVAATP